MSHDMNAHVGGSHVLPCFCCFDDWVNITTVGKVCSLATQSGPERVRQVATDVEVGRMCTTNAAACQSISV
jgi:hypothetical protein